MRRLGAVGMALGVGLVFGLGAACTRGSTGEAADAGALVAANPEAAPAAEGHLYPARRCGECHGREKEEWSASAHAAAASGAYAAVAGRLESAARCAGCHLPLAAGGPRVVGDGVGCDACHTAVGPAQAGDPGAVLTLAPERATRFGPYGDSKDHSFHRVARSSFVVDGALCEACHQDPPGAALPEYTTVAEWRLLEDRSDCVTCHMPSLSGVAAKGERIRSVSRHDFAPDKAAALAQALELTVQPAAAAARIALSNTGADHALPTGRPERRLRLEVNWLDGAGRAVGAETIRFGRRLVDAQGTPSPSFAAAREDGDLRLRPGEPWSHDFARPAGAHQLVVRLSYERFDPAFAGWFGAADAVLILERKETL